MLNEISLFINYLSVECGLSQNTLDAYRRDINKFATYLQRKGITTLQKIKPDYILQFIEYSKNKGLADNSIARNLVALKMFFRFLLAERRLKKDPTALLESPRLWKRVPGVLGYADVQKLLNAPDISRPLGIRDRAILEVLYATGARVSEMINLRLEDVVFEIRCIKCLGKGGKERWIPMEKEAIRTIKLYLQEVRPLLVKKNPSVRYLFISRLGRRLRRETIWKMVRRYGRLAGLRGNIHPHTLRHSIATHLLEGQMDIRYIQEMLGHASVSTTQLYTHIDRSRLKAIHKKYHPRA